MENMYGKMGKTFSHNLAVRERQEYQRSSMECPIEPL